MMDICFSISDEDGKYIKYLAVALCSVMENTKQNLQIHVLHDNTLNDNSKNYLRFLAKRYKNKIFFYELNNITFNLNNSVIRRFTVGTLFRLLLVEVLPITLNKVLYLDVDTVTNIDIKQIWDLNIHDYCLAGCRDIALDRNYSIKNFNIYKYINAGVLLFNLKQIRKILSLKDCSSEFFKKCPKAKYLDQDALNNIFKNKIYFFDKNFNIPTVYARKNDIKDRGIYHFIADMPRDIQQSFPDKLFFKYLQKTPWGKSDIVFRHYENRLIEKDEQIQIVYKMLQKVNASRKRIFWGAGGAIHPLIMQYFEVKNDDYYVDSNPSLWGKIHNNKMVWSPEKILEENKNEIVVIITIFKFNEVANKLKSYGLVENKNFFNGKLLLPEAATNNIYGELKNMWDI